MSSQSPPAAARAVVRCGAFVAHVAPGESLSFGRGQGNDLRLGHDPEDRRVPRVAGRLECRDDGVLVHNLSDKRTLRVQTFPGPEYEILPLMIAGTHPHDQVRLMISGETGTHAITIDTRLLARSGAAGGAGSAGGGGSAGGAGSAGGGTAGPGTAEGAGSDGDRTLGFERIEDLNPRHRIILTALCLPLMTRFGAEADVPTYTQLEEMLERYGYVYKAKTIRNNLDELRHWLTNERGILGLVRDEPASEASTGSLVKRLAQWAILSGNVTDDDLVRLEEHAADRFVEPDPQAE